MNDYTTLVNSAVPSITQLIGNNYAKQTGGGSDFSTMLSQASKSAKSEVQVAEPKKDDTKPAEELVAYAAMTQAAKNPQPVDEKAEQTVEAVATDAAVTPETLEKVDPAAVESIMEMTGITNIDDIAKLLNDLGIMIPSDLSPSNVNAFLTQLLAKIDENLGALADASLAVTTNTKADISQLLTNQPLTNQTVAPTQDATLTIQVVDALPVDIATVEVVDVTVKATDVATADVDVPVLQKVRDHLAAKLGNEPTAEVTDSGTVDATSTETVDVSAVAKGQSNTSTSQDTNQDANADENADTKAQPAKVDNTKDIHMTDTTNTVQRHAAVEQAPTADPVLDVKVNTQNVIDQIVQSAKMVKGDGTSQLEIQLRPEHLGKVTLLLTATEDGVTARIKAQSEQVRGMLTSGLTDLVASLKDMGINMKHIDITHSEMSSDLSRGNSQQQSMHGQGQQRGQQQPQQQPSGRIISLPNPMMARTSNLLYGTSALQPMNEYDVSVDFKA